MDEYRQISHKLCVCEFLSIMYMLRVFIKIKNRIIKYWVLIEMVKYKISVNTIYLSVMNIDVTQLKNHYAGKVYLRFY